MRPHPPSDLADQEPDPGQLSCVCFVCQIMLVEAAVYCLQPRLKIHRAEGSINAGGCSFNSFLRRTVRFVGRTLT